MRQGGCDKICRNAEEFNDFHRAARSDWVADTKLEGITFPVLARHVFDDLDKYVCTVYFYVEDAKDLLAAAGAANETRHLEQV
jgi:hypothetical protein